MSIVVKNLTHIYNEGMPFSSKALDNISFEITKTIIIQPTLIIDSDIIFAATVVEEFFTLS